MKRMLLTAAIIAIVLWPQAAKAEDCGLWGLFVGCGTQLQGKELELQNQLEQAKLQGISQGVVAGEETKRLQLEYNALVAQQQMLAAAQEKQTVANAEVEMERLRLEAETAKAQLEASMEKDRLASEERQASMTAVTGVQMAQIAAQAQVYQAQDDPIQLALVALIVLIAAGGLGFGMWQWRRGKEAQAVMSRPMLYGPSPTIQGYIEPSDKMREKIDYLESRGLSYLWHPNTQQLEFKGPDGKPFMLTDRER